MVARFPARFHDHFDFGHVPVEISFVLSVFADWNVSSVAGTPR
jgi:hypothetical protein